MIEIAIRGTTSLKKIAKLNSIVRFFLSETMPRASSIRIEIVLVANLISLEGVYGDCTCTDDIVPSREFEIRLDSKSDTFETLFHELVHVRQYYRRELVNYIRKPKLCNFKGIQYDWSSSSEQPWEKQASEISQEMYQTWLKSDNTKYE
jgi:hypothetical protein